MAKKQAKESIESDYNKLLKSALKNPNVNEISKIYGNYHDLLRQINGISATIEPGSTILTSNSTS